MHDYYDFEDFLGKEDVKGSLDDFLSLTREIKHLLGKQGYLLDHYISLVLEGFSSKAIHTAAEAGFDATSEFSHMITAAVKDKPDEFDNPFYETVTEYIAAHPFEYQEESTRQELYYILLFHKFMVDAAENFFYECKQPLRKAIDLIEVQQLHEQLCDLVGSLKMEQLYKVLHEQFSFIRPVDAFRQGMTINLLYALTSRDPETSKLMVQLLIDTP